MTYSPQATDPLLPSSIKKGRYIDWPAVIGGIIFASAISIVLLSFGAALGLVFTQMSTQSHPVGAGIAVAIWFIWVEVSSFMAGAYLTGRLRNTFPTTSEHEMEVRDGSHGLLVWAGCVVLGTLLAVSGATNVVSSAGSAIKTIAETAAPATQNAGSAAMQYYSASLLRTTTPTNTSSSTADRTALGNEISLILGRTALGTPSNDDKAYLAQAVAAQTGLSADDAKTRVDKVYAEINQAKADAVNVAEKARKTGIVAAFLLAASLLVSAAAAYYAACSAGRHRDEAVAFTGFFRRM